MARTPLAAFFNIPRREDSDRVGWVTGGRQYRGAVRREGLPQNLYDRWSKEFLEAGKKRRAGATEREASPSDVSGLRKEATPLKEALAETMLGNRLLKKSVLGTGEDAL